MSMSLKDLCRCCHAEGSFDDLALPYTHNGREEVYSNMIKETFNVEMSPVAGPLCVVTYRICKLCVQRVRDAFFFKKQVQNCEALFMDMYRRKYKGLGLNTTVKVELPDSADARDDSSMPDNDMKMEDSDDDSSGEVRETRAMVVRTRTTAFKANQKTETVVKTRMIKEEVGATEEREGIQAKKKKVDKSKVQPKSKPQQQEVDEDFMAFKNTAIIAKNSYVFPFHTRTSLYYCFYCKDQYTNPTELREHTLQHDPVVLYENKAEKKIPKIDITRIDCRLCDTKIDDLDTFKSHITSVHGIKLYPITNEFLKFKLTQDNLACTECGNTFPYFDMLKKHMVEHFGKLICDICGACFLERSSLRTHIRSHNKVDSNFPCDICGKNLKSKYSKDLHIATVHEKRPTVICYKCDASFLSHALRNRHLIEVHGDKRTFPCKMCDKVYNRRKTLMEHIRRNHQKVMRHQCNLCDQRFYIPSQLKEHMATHTGERNFKCDLCDKTYPGRQSLRDHVRTHSTTDKKYKCHLCASAFTQHSNWKNHLKNHHIGYVSTNSNFTPIDNHSNTL